MGMGRDAIHFAPSKRKNDYDGPGTSSAKRQHKPSKTTPHTSNKHSINLLKSQIRTLTRSLDHNDDLPAGVRIEKERALAGYRQDLEDAEHEKRRQAIISRYHMVRFFERQKAERHAKKAVKRLKELEPGTPEHAAAQKQVHIAEVDIKYTQYSPLDQKYEGIYPREANGGSRNPIPGIDAHGNDDDAERIIASRPAMWRIVKNCMKDGTLEALRNGKLTKPLGMGRKKPAAAKAHARGHGGGVMVDFGSTPAPNDVRSARDGGSNDESDGEFFEKEGGWTLDKP